MIKVRNLNKSIDGKVILKDVNFDLERGSIVGLLGRNGAGKTTLMRTLVGILLPDSGLIALDGVDLLDNPKVKERVVYVPDSPTFINQYRVKELMVMYRSIYKHFDSEGFLKLLAQYELPLTHVRNYSKGMKALLAIILAFSTRAEYIILDEPTNGLDPVINRQVLQFIIREVSERGTCVLISTHHMDSIEKIADTVMILKDHTIEQVISLDNTREHASKIQVAFADDFPEELRNLDHVTVLSSMGKVHTLVVTKDIEATLAHIRTFEPLVLEELAMSLEDVFVAKLGGKGDVG